MSRIHGALQAGDGPIEESEIPARVRSMDLNLLRVLGMIFETRSLTVTARRLGLTQSAISHSLRKLRYSFEDELVVRNGQRLILTPRAERLTAPLASWLNDLERTLFRPDRFDPAISDRSFYVAATDQFALAGIPGILSELKKRAPRVRLIVRNWNIQSFQRELEQREIDFAVGVSMVPVPGVKEEVLYRESFASMVRKNHPYLKTAGTAEDFVRWPHLLATFGPPGEKGVIDRVLAERGLSREIQYRFASFAVAPAMVECTDAIFTAPKRFIEVAAKKHRVAVFQPPVKAPTFDQKLFWHLRNHSDQGNIWLRELICKAVG